MTNLLLAHTGLRLPKFNKNERSWVGEGKNDCGAFSRPGLESRGLAAAAAGRRAQAAARYSWPLPAAIQYLSSFLRGGNGKHATHEHVLTLVQGC